MFHGFITTINRQKSGPNSGCILIPRIKQSCSDKLSLSETVWLLWSGTENEFSWTNLWHFVQQSLQPHKAWLQRLQSPDLAPSDFHLFSWNVDRTFWQAWWIGWNNRRLLWRGDRKASTTLRKMSSLEQRLCKEVAGRSN